MQFSKKVSILVLLVVALLVAGVIVIVALTTEKENDSSANSNGNSEGGQFVGSFNPQTQVIAQNLDHPWDLRLSDPQTIFFTQGNKGLFKLELATSEVLSIYEPDDLYSEGEGGMMGLELASNFSVSRIIFVCFNSQINSTPQVIVSKLTLNETFSQVVTREDIVTNIPANSSGRHSGCRILLSEEGYLWITTGDAADASTPQNPQSLGGKILRVDQEGNPVTGNLPEPFDPRIFSYGHRNTQGITLLPNYSDLFGFGFTSEHGPNIDDEINPLLPGNFGWDPIVSYDESVPMTDLEKFPNAIAALWSSGSRTIAASGLLYVRGEIWKDWEGTILLAALKDSYIQRFEILANGQLNPLEEVVSDFGRIRQVYQGFDGLIYFTTDNGDGTDVIARISP
jgi:glucose/arabinose dehydrogenase